MRIGIQAWGSEGDIRPFLALGAGLARAGHRVTLALSDLRGARYERWAPALGVEVRTVAEPPPERSAELGDLSARLLESSAFEQGKLVTERLFRPAVPEMLAAARELVAESDLVVGHYFHHPLRTAAEAAGVPEVSVTLAGDVLPSAAYPPTGLPDLGGWANRAGWALAGFMMRRAFLGPVNQLREEMGLSPARSMADVWHSRLLDLVAVSPTLVPPEDDWPSRHRVCGFLRLPAPERVDPTPPHVEAFLDAGDPPVYVGFGSLSPTDAEVRAALVREVETALARAGRRGVLQGLAEPGGRGGSPHILHVGRLPHDRIFPRCAAVVHHGGAGTTQTAVVAGVPMVVVPHVADQFWWAGLLERRGVASRPLPRTRLDAARLAERVEAALDPAMAARASELGSRVRAEEDGVAVAVRWIEEVARAEGLGDASTER